MYCIYFEGVGGTYYRQSLIRACVYGFGESPDVQLWHAPTRPVTRRDAPESSGGGVHFALVNRHGEFKVGFVGNNVKKKYQKDNVKLTF